MHPLRVVHPDETRPFLGMAWSQHGMCIALTLWLGLFVAHAVKTLIHPEKRTVYPIFAQATRNWWHDRPLYVRAPGWDQYYYSPACAVLTTPFGLLPDGPGGVLWSAVSLGMLFASLRSFVRHVLWPLFPRMNEGLFLTLCLGITIQGAWSGQSNALILACLLFAATSIVQERWWLAAFLLALPIQIKIWPLLAAGLLALRWPRLAPRLLTASVLLALVPLLTRSPAIVWEHYQDWSDTLIARTLIEVRRSGYRDAWTLWECLWPPVNAALYSALQAACGLGLAAYLWLEGRKWNDPRQYVLRSLALWLSWQLLLGPGTERLTYGMMAPFASWVVLRSFELQRGRVLATCGWLFAGPLGTGEVERLLGRIIPAAPALVPGAILAVAAWLLVCDSRPTRALAILPIDTLESNSRPVRRAA